MAESRDRGEPVEITALRTNLNVITRALTVGATLQWFADCLVEKSFITRPAAQGILHQDGTARISKADELLDSVFNTIRATQEKRHRFNEFVSIFSNDSVYEDLVTNLQRGVVQVVSNLPLHFSSEPAYTRDLLSPTSPSTSTVLDSGVEESFDASPSDDPPVTGLYNPRSFVTRSPSFSSQSSTTSSWSLDRVKATIDVLEGTFGNIYADTEIQLSDKEANDDHFFIIFRCRLLLLPVRKSILHVKFFDVSEDDILEAKTSKKILAILSRYMDYQNYEMLKSIVNKFCSTSLKKVMEKFCESLEEFETATTVDVYLSAIPDDVTEELMTGFSKMVVKINRPSSQCTLHEVRKLNKAIIKESTLCSHSVYIGAVSRNCVVVRFRFPSSAVGWVLAAITPDFMTTHRLTEVSVDGRQLSHVQAPQYQLNDELIAASKSGDVIKAASFLNSGADIEAKGKSATSLNHASQRGNVQVVRLLISRGAGLQSRDKDGWTPLMFAAVGGECEAVKDMISEGADVNAQNNVGNSALIIAATEGHTDATVALVRAGTKLDLQNNEGDTPLILAAGRGHITVVPELVKAGANLNIQNNDGDSAVIRSTMEYQPGTLRELLMAGSDLRLRNKEGLTALMIADRSDRTDITNILQQTDLGNKENLCGRKRRQPALYPPVEIETQPLLKCSKQALLPAKRAGNNGLTSGYNNQASAAGKSQRVSFANKSPLRIKRDTPLTRLGTNHVSFCQKKERERIKQYATQRRHLRSDGKDPTSKQPSQIGRKITERPPDIVPWT